MRCLVGRFLPLALVASLVSASSNGVDVGSSVPTSTRELINRDTITPPLFQDIFGPIDFVNNADGYMGFESLATYDVNACAEACNTRTYDNKSGPCIYFNIWQAVINDTPSSVICSLYNTFTDSSTATNAGQGDLHVSLSRGFSRLTILQDGSFQDYTCVLAPNKACPFEPSNFWTRHYLESFDYVLIDNNPARSGTSSCVFVFQPPTNAPTAAFGATLTYTQPLNTTAGHQYIISFFYTLNTLSSQSLSNDLPLFSVFWNNENVLDVLQVGSEITFQYWNAHVKVTATGDNDTLFFKNGVSFPHALYLDDIAVFPKF